MPSTNVQTGITMINNTTESVVIPSGKNVKLNVNGKTITGTSTSTVTINNKGTLYLYGGTVTKGSNVIENNGTMTFVNGTISNGSNFAMANNSTFTMTGGTISNTGGSHAFCNVKTATITGGNITLSNDSTSTAVYNISSLKMTGGNVSSSAHGIYTRGNGAKATISNVTVSGRIAIGVDTYGKITATSVRVTSGNIECNMDDLVNMNGLTLYNCTLASSVKIYGDAIGVWTDSTGYTVYLYNKSSSTLPYFPTWTAEGGQDDITWGTGTAVTHANTNAWKYKVNKSEHNNKSGTYYTHIYINGTSTKAGEVTVTL